MRSAMLGEDNQGGPIRSYANARLLGRNLCCSWHKKQRFAFLGFHPSSGVACLEDVAGWIAPVGATLQPRKVGAGQRLRMNAIPMPLVGLIIRPPVNPTLVLRQKAGAIPAGNNSAVRSTASDLTASRRGRSRFGRALCPFDAVKIEAAVTQVLHRAGLAASQQVVD